MPRFSNVSTASNQSKRVKEETVPFIQNHRRIRAHLNFRRLVRLVIANYFWISEISHNENLGYSYVKNIGMVLRRKKKEGKKYFNLPIKALLMKRPEWRTDAEKAVLEKVLITLKFVHNYPPESQKALAAVTGFMYYGPGRTLIRQQHTVNNVYFLVTGSITASRNVINRTSMTIETKNVVMKSGLIIGDMALLHNDVKRMATITTNEDCEFLVVPGEDYIRIMKPQAMMKWNCIENAMQRFHNISSFHADAVLDVCLFARIVKHTAGKTILSNKVGCHSTFFVLSGNCRLMEYLLVYKAPTGYGGFAYNFFSFEEESTYKQRNQTSTSLSVDSITESTKSSVDDSKRTSLFPTQKSYRALPSLEVKDIYAFKRNEKSTKSFDPISEDLKSESKRFSVDYNKRSSLFPIHKSSRALPTLEQNDSHIFIQKEKLNKADDLTSEDSSNGSKKLSMGYTRRSSFIPTYRSSRVPSLELKDGHTLKWKENSKKSEDLISHDSSDESKKFSPDDDKRSSLFPTNKSSKALPSVELKDSHTFKRKEKSKKAKNLMSAKDEVMNGLPLHVEGYTMELCTYMPNTVFGVGERMRRRYVLAATPVEMLVVPKHILKKHKINFCEVVRSLLDARIPKSQQVFEHFLGQRNFRNYRKELIASLPHRPTGNRFENIPHSIQTNYHIIK